jgi:DNA-binding NtrC family response regulator
MQKPLVLMVTGDRQDGKRFCGLLGAMHYNARMLTSLEELHMCLQEASEVAVILDLDTIAADKQFFRTLHRSHPRLHILGISSLAYHPGREEVIGSLYACLVKPLDTEELGYWLKTIAENLSETESPTGREVGA